MGLYGDYVLPPVLEWVLSARNFQALRPAALARARGTVLEVGFGAGLNLEHYPATVEKILALEPSLRLRGRAAARVARSAIPVEFVGLDGETIPLPAESVDTVVTTWTLCSIPDPVRALREFARVLKPEGRYLFIEHGLSPDASLAFRQNLITPIQKRLMGGCHHNRKIDALISEAGLRIEALENFYDPGQARIGAYQYRGSAKR